MKAVVDTNVLVSAMLSSAGSSAELVSAALDGKITVCCNQTILAEYQDVLYRPKFHFKPERVKMILNAIAELGKIINPQASIFPLADEDEDKLIFFYDTIFYETAQASGALLVTNNIKHYPPEPFIVTPQNFIKRLKRRKKP